VVVYLHGWGANLPFEWHQAWFEHLLARGSAVLAFWSLLGAVPASEKEYRVIRTTDDLLADHEAPTAIHDPVVRRTFWGPLDRLVASARRSADR
jgi:hypothetical protein